MSFLGLDLGATNAKAGVVDGSGRVVAFEARPLAAAGEVAARLSPREVVERLMRCGSLALAAAGVEWRAVRGVGVGTPGAIDDGVVLAAANLFEGHGPAPLRSLVATAAAELAGCPVPVVLVNDADAALWAELSTGAARGDVAMLTLGSGVGCSVATAGRVVAGATGTLEGGHMIVNASPDARPCTCGSRGCLEAYASAKAVAASYRERSGADRDCAAVFRLADDGDPLALDVVDHAARYVAVGAINLIRILDPAAVVLAGGVAAAGDAFLQRVRANMDRLDWTCLPRRSDRLALAASGPHTGVIGAACAVKAQLQAPEPGRAPPALSRLPS